MDDPRPADEIVRDVLNAWEIADKGRLILQREGLSDPPEDSGATAN